MSKSYEIMIVGGKTMSLLEKAMMASLFFLLAITFIATTIIRTIQQNLETVTLLIIATLGLGVLALGFATLVTITILVVKQ